MIVAYTQSPRMAYILAAGLLLLGAVLSLLTNAPAAAVEKERFIGIPVSEKINVK
jgi:4-hydroxybenzoate polyprenyltransferase